MGFISEIFGRWFYGDDEYKRRCRRRDAKRAKYRQLVKELEAVPAVCIDCGGGCSLREQMMCLRVSIELSEKRKMRQDADALSRIRAARIAQAGQEPERWDTANEP